MGSWIVGAVLAAWVGALEEPVTFHRDIRPLIERHCQHCHRPNMGAPFSLLTYRDVQKRARQIVEVVGSGFMPPWLPTAGAEPFVGSRGVPAADVELLRRWWKAGAPAGKGDTTAGATSLSDTSRTVWSLGKPDLVLEERRPFTVPAEGLGVLQTFVLPIPNDAPAFVRAIDFAPSSARVLHGSLYLTDTTGYAKLFDEQSPGPGYPAMGGVGLNLAGSLGGWAVGTRPFALPPGYGWPLPAGADFSVQTHLNPIGRSESLRFQVGLYAAVGEVVHPVAAIGMTSVRIDIPPNVPDYAVESEYECPVDAQLIGLVPNAHLLCQTIEVRAVAPTGESRLLLRIDDWDMNWQQPYHYEHPVALSAGTRVRMRFTYDNTLDNPQNPHEPPQRVTIGKAPDGEVAILLLHLAPERAADFERLQRSHIESLSRQLKEGR